MKDAGGNVVLSIVGPACICDGPYACCCENKFTVSVHNAVDLNEIVDWYC